MAYWGDYSFQDYHPPRYNAVFAGSKLAPVGFGIKPIHNNRVKIIIL
jgi:hypothetical protein